MDELNQQPAAASSQPIVVNNQSGSSKAWLWVVIIVIVLGLLFILFAQKDEGNDIYNENVPTQNTSGTSQADEVSVNEASNMQAELEATAIEGMSDSF